MLVCVYCKESCEQMYIPLGNFVFYYAPKPNCFLVRTFRFRYKIKKQKKLYLWTKYFFLSHWYYGLFIVICQLSHITDTTDLTSANSSPPHAPAQ